MPRAFKLLAAVAPLALATAIALPSQARADAAQSSSSTVRDHRTSQGVVRDHRTTAPERLAPTETRLTPRVGQRLDLAGGSSLILRPGGVLEIIGMNGLVARTFKDATIIEDDSGQVWIASAGQRFRAGTLQRTSPSSVVRDHRTPQTTVRDHRTTAPQLVAPTDTRLNLRVGQRLKLAGGAFLNLRPGGVLEIIGMNGLVARTFQNPTIVRDRSGVVWIISDGQRVRAGMTGR